MLGRIIASFAPRNQPWMTRQSYVHELINASTYPAAVALIEGGVIGILAKKTFNVPTGLFAVIMAAPSFAHITSFLWARLARGRRKVRFINALQILALVSIGLIAVIPTRPPGPLLLTVLVVVARCILAGIVTMRSTVWRHNYPRHVRASVTGRLTIIQSTVMAATPLIGFALLDWRPQVFPYVYLAGIALAAVGTTSFSRIRLRGERELLRYERTPAARPKPHGDVAPLYEYDPAEDMGFWAVLKRDPFFRRYMLWQFIAGGGNMMGETVVVCLAADLTKDAARPYLTAILITTTIPSILAMLTLPWWARRLDKVHIAQFRAEQSWLWIVDQGGNWLAAWLGSLPVIGAVRFVQGTVRAAGMLAWNLGHNDFADRRMVAAYMGVHVTLTGVRGFVFPVLGVCLYSGWKQTPLPWGLGTIPAWPGVGGHVFVLSILLTTVATIGFNSLARKVGRMPKVGA